MLGVQGDTETHIAVSTGVGTGVQSDTETKIAVNKVVGAGCSR